jgi:hypothetical protein
MILCPYCEQQLTHHHPDCPVIQEHEALRLAGLCKECRDLPTEKVHT